MAKKDWERSTSAHNTVTVSGRNSSDVWSTFRLVIATCQILHESPMCVVAEHNGFAPLELHKRKFEIINDVIIIDDIVIGSKTEACAHFHCFSLIPPSFVSKNTLKIEKLFIDFRGTFDIVIEQYEASLGFNILEKRFKLSVNFEKKLQTQIFSNGIE